MKNYFCIQNNGEVDIRSFYIMGMGTKVNDSESIGQFGTGNKYGLIALLREEIEVVIVSGSDKVKVFTKEVEFREQTFKQIYLKHKGEEIETSLTLDMGQLNWNSDRGIKEIVSNAIDEGGLDISQSTRIIPKKGVTRIYIEDCFKTRKFFDHIDDHFSIYRDPIFNCDVGSIYVKLDKKTRAYRKGVCVFESDIESLFDYELHEVDVREDRTSSQFDVRWELPRLINDMPIEIKKEIIMSLKDLDIEGNKLESVFESSNIIYSKDYAKITDGFVVVNSIQSRLYENDLFSFNQLVLPAYWVDFLKRNDGVKTIKDVLNDSQLEGWESEKTDKYIEDTLKDVIEFINDIGYELTREKIIVSDNKKENAPMGQFVNNKYYINKSVFKKGFDEVLDTIVHEMLHDLSKSGDKTDQFEYFIINEMMYHCKRLKVYLKQEVV